jgi:hypothetical protein
MLNWNNEAIASSEPCAVSHCGSFEVDPHHRKQRSAGGSDNRENIVYLCRRHHDWVHNHIDYAHLLGLIIYDHEPEPTEVMTVVRTKPIMKKPVRPNNFPVQFELDDILGNEEPVIEHDLEPF